MGGRERERGRRVLWVTQFLQVTAGVGRKSVFEFDKVARVFDAYERANVSCGGDGNGDVAANRL